MMARFGRFPRHCRFCEKRFYAPAKPEAAEGAPPSDTA
jgi:hypothetical protein